MKIAFDCHIPKKAEKALLHHELVYRAPEGAQDEWWYREAKAFGAECFISQDIDIANLALNDGLTVIRPPHKVGGVNLINFIRKRVSRL